MFWSASYSTCVLYTKTIIHLSVSESGGYLLPLSIGEYCQIYCKSVLKNKVTENFFPQIVHHQRCQLTLICLSILNGTNAGKN